MKAVRDLRPKKGMKISELVKEFSTIGGFSAQKLGDAFDILERMYKEKNITIFMSFPACIISTGIRGIIKEMVKRNFVDVIITTVGTLDYDISRLWKNYYVGSFSLDDYELLKKKYHRIGSVITPQEHYGGILEEKLQPILKKIYENSESLGSYELIWKIAENLKSEKNAKDSIIYWAYKNKVPVIIPGISDGAVGSNLWMVWEEKRKPLIDTFKDEHLLSDIIFTSEKTGALILGGGISKHHTIWWNQFKEGLDYAVYITTAVEWDGSLSGAPPREAISWKKINPKAKHIQVEGDITVLLPLLFYSLIDSIPKRERKKRG